MHPTTWQIMGPFWKGFFTPVIWLLFFALVIVSILMKMIFGRIEKAIKQKRKRSK
jgi:F0F1-type ATP synthase membrane subunit b/b'